MPLTQVQDNGNPGGGYHFACGFLSGTYTAADFTLTLGFSPKHFRIVNLTARVMYEWYQGMNVGDYLKTAAAGTRTLETDDLLIVTTAGEANTVFVEATSDIQDDNASVYWEAKA